MKSPRQLLATLLEAIRLYGKRYVLCGFMTMAVLWGTWITLEECFHVHYFIAVNVATGVAWVYAYFVNKYIVFRKKEGTHVRQGGRFILLQVVMYVFSVGVLVFGVEVLGLSDYLIGVVMGIVNVGVSFVVMRFVVFT